ncbi:hypothetical protein FALCPG4_015891 [Fusarium falciforme]
MVGWPDRVDILVAKNNGFKEGDPCRRMLETVASSLRDISILDLSDPVATDTMQNLWTSLALKMTSLPTAGEETPAFHDHPPSLLSHLEEFRTLVNDVARSPTQDGLEEAVLDAYDMCRHYNEQDFERITGNSSNTRSLRNALGFLGRLRTCFNTFIRGAERFSNFQSLPIHPVTVLSTSGTRSKKRNPADYWSVGKTFSSLGLTLDDKTVESVVGTGKRKEPWTKNRLLQRFDKLKSSVSEVHAEIQVILDAARHDRTGALTFKYVGCSKRSCFLCSRFVQNYGSFATRGCHGKLYDLWTVPELSWLAEEERLNLAQTLKHVERAMKDSVRNRKGDGFVHNQESTVGGSSVATIRQQFSNPYMASVVSQHLRYQREEVRAATSKQGGFEDPV